MWQGWRGTSWQDVRCKWVIVLMFHFPHLILYPTLYCRISWSQAVYDVFHVSIEQRADDIKQMLVRNNIYEKRSTNLELCARMPILIHISKRWASGRVSKPISRAYFYAVHLKPLTLILRLHLKFAVSLSDPSSLTRNNATKISIIKCQLKYPGCEEGLEQWYVSWYDAARRQCKEDCPHGKVCQFYWQR